MNPGKKKNPLSSDKSWQFPKEKALDTCLMRRKKKWGRKLFYLLLKTRTLPGQIKPKAKHIQVTNSQHVFPEITWEKRQVIVKVREALRDGQACCAVCRDWAKRLKTCNSTFHFRVWLLPSEWLGGGEMGAGSTTEAEPLPGAQSTCTAPSRPPSPSANSPSPFPAVPRKPGALYFPRPGLRPDLTPGARLVNGGKIPEGDGRGRARRNKHFK